MKKDYYSADEITIAGCDINLLYECNLRCKYCFVNDNHNNHGGVLTIEKAKEILEYIFQHHSKKTHIIITLMGGEPLMNMNVFEEILIYSNDLGEKYQKEVSFITTTNAVLLDEEKLAILEKYNVGFIMSLDSHNQEINDYLRSDIHHQFSVFNKVMEIVNKVKTKIDIHINVTITPLNLDIYNTAYYLFEQGVKNIHFYLCDSDRKDMLFMSEHIEKLKLEYDKICDYLLQQFKNDNFITCQPLTDYMKELHLKTPIYFPCSTLKNRMAFDHDGNLYPCIVLMEKEYSFGNINGDMDQKRIMELKKTMLTENKCEYCWARYLCGGECLSIKLWQDKKQKSLRCDLKRHIFALRLYLYDQIILVNKNYFV